MILQTAPLLNKRRFHTSVPAVASAFFLFGAIQTLALAAEELLHPAVVYVVNLLIEHGRFDVLRISQREAIWQLAVANLIFSAVFLSISLALANWNYRKRGA